MANNVSPSSQDVLDFLAAIRDNDEYGLGQWYLLKDGASTAVCASLRAKYPGLWQHAAKVVTGELTLK